MRGLLAGATLLLISTAAFAQNLNSDLTIRFGADALPGSGDIRVRPGQFITYLGSPDNRGPAHANNVTASFDVPGEIVAVVPPYGPGDCGTTQPIDCAFYTVAPNQFSSLVRIATKAPLTMGEYTATATIKSSNPDPNPADNTISFRVTVLDTADVNVFIAPGSPRIERGEVRNVGVAIGTSGKVVQNLRLVVRAVGEGTIAGVAAPEGLTCTSDASEATCTAPAFGPASRTVTVRLQAPDRNTPGAIGLQAAVSSDSEDFDPSNNAASMTATMIQQFAVTTAADSGGGSLRQAILDSVQPCSVAPCRIVFHLPAPVPESGWFTIHPESPLPALQGMVSVDGATQTALTGDTNPFGPEIEIRGDRQPDGDGITLGAVCESSVSGLAINGFPVHAVSVRDGPVCRATVGLPLVISRNVIGLDPTGSTPVPNLRGIFVGGPDTIYIFDNLIGGNRLSAIFLAAGRDTFIQNNVIGLTRDGAPAPNGASGIFVNTSLNTIAGNVIANSRDFGIAVSPTVFAISMQRNRIFDIGHTAIDFGLDLETPNGDDLHGKILNHPVLLSAHYDAAADKTIVRGRFDTARSFSGNIVIELFASHGLNARGHAQAERFLGELRATGAHADFELAVAGDLTGQWIAATATYQDSLSPVRDDTSELSNSIQVSQ
jgi:hypothetical protein